MSERVFGFVAVVVVLFVGVVAGRSIDENEKQYVENKCCEEEKYK